METLTHSKVGYKGLEVWPNFVMTSRLCVQMLALRKDIALVENVSASPDTSELIAV